MLTPDPLNWGLSAALLLAWGGVTWAALRKPAPRPQPAADLTIAWASQSGRAEALARRLGARLAPLQPALLPLEAVDPRSSRRLIMVLATSGEGDAPDHARAFESGPMRQALDLRGHQLAILALGDRSYPRFCAFGRRVEAWARASGAEMLLERRDLDRDAMGEAEAWIEALAARLDPQVSAPIQAPAPAVPRPTPHAPRWRLSAREHLNPGSPGNPLWRLVFQPEDPTTALDWQPGDVAELAIPRPGAAAVTRDYSIASIPASGAVELLVREVTREDGSPGLGSHHLTRVLGEGETVALGLRRNRAAHAFDDQVPLVLIGHGAGLAGLIGHLRHRAAIVGSGPIWLLHGERSPRHDRPLGHELEAHEESGALTRLDRLFSRGPDPRHVQAGLLDEPERLRAWILQGAHLHLCGQARTMGEGVEAVLAELLGEAGLERLISEGRLRRDLY